MAYSIVPQSNPSTALLDGVFQSEGHYFDAFEGSIGALVDAGLITPAELEPQERREPGYTAFLPSGEPCPPGKKAWRTAGYRALRQLEDGTIRLEVTVSKDEQALRRTAKRAREYENEQARINEALALVGNDLRGKALRTEYGSWGESWTGTKAQMQAAGLGIGMLFPGEPGAKKKVVCKCPIGFKFEVRQHIDKVKAAAGLFTAHSRYEPQETDAKRLEVRLAAGRANESAAEFRAAQSRAVDGFINMIFCALHSPALRAWRFNIPEDKDATAKLAEAFQMIRDVLKQGEVVPNPKLQARLQLASARNDAALQTLLSSAQEQPAQRPSGDAEGGPKCQA